MYANGRQGPAEWPGRSYTAGVIRVGGVHAALRPPSRGSRQIGGGHGPPTEGQARARGGGSESTRSDG